MKHQPHKRTSFVVPIVGLCLAVGVFAFAFLMRDRVLPGVRVGDVALGWRTTAEARALVDRAAFQLRPNVTIAGTSEHPSFVELGIVVELDATVAQALPTSAWWQSAVRGQPLPLELTSYPELAEPWARAEAEERGIAPQDAGLITVDGVAALLPDRAGSRMDVQSLQTAITPQLAVLKPASATAAFFPTESRIRVADLLPLKDEVDALVRRGVQLAAGDHQIALTGAELHQWLIVEAQPAGVRTVSALTIPARSVARLAINPDAVRASVTALAPTLSREPTAERLLVSENKVEVLTFGAPGTRLDVEAAVERITDELLTGDAATIELPLIEVPFPVINEDAPPAPIATGKVIAVDLTTMVEYLYEDGRFVYSSKVSPGKNNWTPTGTFRIYAKTEKQKMSGPGYYVPGVPHILWFKGDYSLHGVYWHDKFGVEARSHGCVGEPLAEAAWIYDWTPVGTPVVITRS